MLISCYITKGAHLPTKIPLKPLDPFVEEAAVVLQTAPAERECPLPSPAASSVRLVGGDDYRGSTLVFFPMKNHHHNGPLHPTTRALIHETIATRAYELWEKYGNPQNQALDNWLQAERELVSGKRVRRPGSNPPHALAS